MFGLNPKEVAAIRKQKRLGVALRILELAHKYKGITADECIKKIGLPHQTVSARYSELVRCGCLVPTSKKKETHQGGMARVHIVPKNTTFIQYMGSNRRSMKNRWKNHSDLDQKVLATAYDFMVRWRKASNNSGKKQKLALDLISTLGSKLAYQMEDAK